MVFNQRGQPASGKFPKWLRQIKNRAANAFLAAFDDIFMGRQAEFA